MAESKYNSTKYGPNKIPDDSRPVDYGREYKVPLHGNGIHAMYGGTDDTQPYPNGSGGLLPSGEANFFSTEQHYSYDPAVRVGGTGPSGINAFYPSGDYENFRNYATQKFGSVPEDTSDFTEWVLHQVHPADGSLGLKSGVFLTFAEYPFEISDTVRQSGILHADKTFFEAGSGNLGWVKKANASQNRDRLAQSQYSNAERSTEVIQKKQKIRQIRSYIPKPERGSLLAVGQGKTEDPFTPYIHYSPLLEANGQPVSIYIKFLADYKYSTNYQSPYN
jgi:hypothetical protein|tara:strand:- start:516 stop:1346 length:831 start_codon:yes stop_codon:yes gene_type:complete